MSHIFVVEFEGEEDRKFYLEKDPEHLEFKTKVSAGGVVAGVQVVDFVPGVF